MLFKHTDKKVSIQFVSDNTITAYQLTSLHNTQLRNKQSQQSQMN